MTVRTKPNSPAGASNHENLDLKAQSYSHALFFDHVVKECKCVLKEWRKYVNRVVDAERDAQTAFETVLKSSKAKQQKIEQRNSEVALLALSLVTGPALSWIGGIIENVIFPKYFSTRANVNQRIKLARESQPQVVAPFVMHSTQAHHDRAWPRCSAITYPVRSTQRCGRPAGCLQQDAATCERKVLPGAPVPGYYSSQRGQHPDTGQPPNSIGERTERRGGQNESRICSWRYPHPIGIGQESREKYRQ